MKFRILITLLSYTFIVTSLIACGGNNGDEPVPAGKVSLSSESLLAQPDAHTLSLTVTVDQAWSIRTYEDWVKLNPAGGMRNVPTEVKVTVTANPGMEERSATLSIIAGGETIKTVPLTQAARSQAVPSLDEIAFGAVKSTAEITVTSTAAWEISTSDDWISAVPAKGGKGTTNVTVTAVANSSDKTRTGVLTLTCGGSSTEIKVTQLDEVVNVPEGYTLVWSDEFNEGTVPGTDWVHENWAAGHVNNELQTYTDKAVDGKRTTEIKDGLLHINCFKGKDGKIYSGRMNARPGTGWLYGYFEARICLPKGKGTWPAFWMMPSNVDWNTNPWPKCGEIDIMEEVGADPDQVSSSLHTQNYNHTKGTQKTHAMRCDGAEGGFHTYAVEWTEDAITTYVDGKVQLRCTKAEMGADHDSWPFHYAFYPILNLAWGGDWGGYKGVDESAIPLTMKVDYVRIFQKSAK